MASTLPSPFIELGSFPYQTTESYLAEPGNSMPVGFSGTDSLSGSLLGTSQTIDRCPLLRTSFPDLINASEGVLDPVQMPAAQGFGDLSFPQCLLENEGDEYPRSRSESGFQVTGDPLAPDLRPVFGAGDGKGMRGDLMEGMDEATLRVSRYSPAEKKMRIERYLRKKNRRNYNKTIKYACRKTLADSRQRIRGRFARNNGELQSASSPSWSDGNHSFNEGIDIDFLSYYSLFERDTNIGNPEYLN